MKEEQRVLTLDDFEHRIVVHALNDLRNEQLEQNHPTEDIDELLLRTIEAPTKRCAKRRGDAR